MSVKQVIVIRKDLKMRRGKEIAQGAHAAMAWLASRLQMDESGDDFTNFFGAVSDDEWDWLNGLHAKITLQVDSEEALVAIYDAARQADLEVHLITDAGATEFHGVPTKTCLAIGPADASKIDPITKNLKLY